MGKYSELHIKIQDELINLSHQAEEGELSNLDALIEMREHRTELEKGLALIKDFEETKINEIANEAQQYPDGYRGFEIKAVNGRKTFDFKGVPAWLEAENNKKNIEDVYKNAFEGNQKGTVITTKLSEDSETLGWVSPDGETLPFPEINYGKSYLTVKVKK